MSFTEDIVRRGALKQGDKGQLVKTLQLLLRQAGHELVVDGDFGGATRSAVELFQAKNRIAADGLVGPVTASYLESKTGEIIEPVKPLPSVIDVSPWLTYARALSGIKEIPGAKSNPLILAWVRSLAARYPYLKANINWYVNDDTPWCGLSMAEFVGECTPGFAPPSAPLRALNWGEYGTDAGGPIQGAIAVKERVGGGHVTLVESIWKGKVYCRGGNQGNMINVSEYNIKDFKFWRWPIGATLPKNAKPVEKKFAALGGVTEA